MHGEYKFKLKIVGVNLKRKRNDVVSYQGVAILLLGGFLVSFLTTLFDALIIIYAKGRDQRGQGFVIPEDRYSLKGGTPCNILNESVL